MLLSNKGSRQKLMTKQAERHVTRAENVAANKKSSMMDALCDDMLHLVLAKLNIQDLHRAMMVSSHWRQAAQSPKLFTELQFFNFPLLNDAALDRCLTYAAGGLEVLALEENTQVTEGGLARLRAQTQLQTLYIVGCPNIGPGIANSLPLYLGTGYLRNCSSLLSTHDPEYETSPFKKYAVDVDECDAPFHIENGDQMTWITKCRACDAITVGCDLFYLSPTCLEACDYYANQLFTPIVYCNACKMDYCVTCKPGFTKCEGCGNMIAYCGDCVEDDDFVSCGRCKTTRCRETCTIDAACEQCHKDMRTCCFWRSRESDTVDAYCEDWRFNLPDGLAFNRDAPLRCFDCIEPKADSE